MGIEGTHRRLGLGRVVSTLLALAARARWGRRAGHNLAIRGTTHNRRGRPLWTRAALSVALAQHERVRPDRGRTGGGRWLRGLSTRLPGTVIPAFGPTRGRGSTRVEQSLGQGVLAEPRHPHGTCRGRAFRAGRKARHSPAWVCRSCSRQTVSRPAKASCGALGSGCRDRARSAIPAPQPGRTQPTRCSWKSCSRDPSVSPGIHRRPTPGDHAAGA